MRRHCDGTDDLLLREVPADEVGDRTVLRWSPRHAGNVCVPCDCGLVFDDVDRMVFYPHEALPSPRAPAGTFERFMQRR